MAARAFYMLVAGISLLVGSMLVVFVEYPIMNALDSAEPDHHITVEYTTEVQP